MDSAQGKQFNPEEVICRVDIVLTKDGNFYWKGPEDEITFNGMCHQAMIMNRESILRKRSQAKLKQTAEHIILTPRTMFSTVPHDNDPSKAL